MIKGGPEMKCRLKCVSTKIFFLFFLLIQSVSADPEAVLVKDINTTYFWTGDNSPDPDLDGPSSNPGNFTNINGTVFFTATETETETYGEGFFSDIISTRFTGLWTTDGTESGTVLVHRMENNDHLELRNVNSTLMFSASTRKYGRQLWKSDGTQSGTMLVKVINPGDVRNLVVVNNKLFFTAQDSFGLGLWQSDGTENGTKRVSDINFDQPIWFNVIDNILFFTNFDIVDVLYQTEMWKSDGTEDGTIRVPEIDGARYSTTVNNSFFFYRSGVGVDGTLELWKSDKTGSDPSRVKEFLNSKGNYLTGLTTVRSKLFFFKVGGYRLWVSDGTTDGTIPLTEDLSSEGLPEILGSYNGILFFSTYREDGIELWRSDGTLEGTGLVKNTTQNRENDQLINFNSINHTFYFAIGKYSHFKDELWQTDGTNYGTKLVKEFWENEYQDSFQGVSLVTEINGLLLFAASNGYQGRELWRITNSNVTENITADFDSDNDIDKDDLTVMKTRFGQSASSSDDPYDINKDGVINVLDFRQAIKMCTRTRCATF